MAMIAALVVRVQRKIPSVERLAHQQPIDWCAALTLGTKRLGRTTSVLNRPLIPCDCAGSRVGASAHSLVDLQAAIDRYLVEHNAQPEPFVWSADPDAIIVVVKRGYRTGSVCSLRVGLLPSRIAPEPFVGSL
jgi:hypothetical protein